MYKYVNKKNISTTVGGISFTPYSGYTSSTAIPALDIVSNGWDFDRYYNEVLTNTSNDDIPIGEIRYFPSNPGNGWLACDGQPHLRSDYPALAATMPNPAWKFEIVPGPIGANPSFTYNPFWTGTSWIMQASVGPTNGMFRCTDLSAGVWTLTTSPVIGACRKLSSGRLVCVGSLSTTPGTKSSAYSDDDGITWSAATALPAGFTYVRCLVATSKAIYVPAPGTYKVFWTADGVTWADYTLTATGEWCGILQEGNSNYLLLLRDEGLPVEISVNGGTGAPNWNGSGAYMVFTPPATIGGDVKLPGGEIVVVSRGAKYILSQDPVGGAISTSSAISGGVSPIGIINIANMVLVLSYGQYSTSKWCAWKVEGDETWSVGEIAPTHILGTVINYGAQICFASGNGEALLCLVSQDFTVPLLTRVTTDITKFNAPGNASISGAYPYVYTGV